LNAAKDFDGILSDADATLDGFSGDFVSNYTGTINDKVPFHETPLPPEKKVGEILLPGTDITIFIIFSQKNSACFTQSKAKFCNILIITLFFENNANFIAENRRKL
jgi:hypothetical protein